MLSMNLKNVFIVSSSKSSQSVNDVRKDGYNDGATSTGTISSNTRTSSSALSLLKTPTQSDLSRKRVVARNLPCGK